METAAARYEHLKDRLLALYREGRQQEALELLEPLDPDMAPWSAELAHFAACMHGSLGNAAEALDALESASAAGGWWHDSLLLEDDDLVALRELPEFLRLVEVSRERSSNDSVSWTIELPEVAATGVVVALHGAGQSATRAARDWAPVLDLGYALVCIESSQRISPNFRTWVERDLVVEDLRKVLAELPDALRGYRSLR